MPPMRTSSKPSPLTSPKIAMFAPNRLVKVPATDPLNIICLIESSIFVRSIFSGQGSWLPKNKYTIPLRAPSSATPINKSASPSPFTSPALSTTTFAKASPAVDVSGPTNKVARSVASKRASCAEAVLSLPTSRSLLSPIKSLSMSSHSVASNGNGSLMSNLASLSSLGSSLLPS